VIHKKKKSRLSVAFFALMPLLAFGSVYWKIQHDKFPYVGTWAGSWIGRHGDAVRMAVSFNADGSCSWAGETLGHITRYSCSYQMQERSALVTVRLHQAQVIKGELRVPKTPKELAEAPIFTVVGLHRVTPFRDGEAVLVASDESRLIHEDTGQSKGYPRRFKQNFYRQK
jgi:hypothetical protein